MTIKLYNSLTKSKDILKPINPDCITLYVCGITVYDDCHIGHARVFVMFDMLVRFLKAQGHQVKYVRNITDIDDKIIARANKKNIDFKALTDTYIAHMQEDAAALFVNAPDQEPRATDAIAQMQAMILTLIDKGVAYTVNGDVYYRVSAFESYGALSHRTLEDMQEGARVDVNEAKENPLDFVLWKKAKADEPAWDSPWGAGRPGWHIECSAMSTECLGAHFDIHGGGADLLFPHHENERAQSEAATGEKFVNNWMHVGFVQVDEEKMSKSLGNFFTIRDVLKVYDGEVIRFFLMNSHYRSPLNYSTDNLDAAKQSLTRLYTALGTVTDPETNVSLIQAHGYYQQFMAAMADDLNSPQAFATLFECAKDIHKAAAEDKPLLVGVLKTLGETLGLFNQSPDAYFKADSGVDADEIEALIAARNAARESKDWAKADALRDTLTAKGIVLEDKNGQTTWRKA